MIQQDFDALQHELDRAAKFQQSLSIELSSCHNYTDGITYYYVYHGDLELGRYWKHPWFDGWIFVSFGIGGGIQQESETDYEAIARITKSWREVL